VNGNLTLTLGKRPITYNLSPWDGNTFSATCPQWSPAFNGRVPFPEKNKNPEKLFRLKSKIRKNFSGKKQNPGKRFRLKIKIRKNFFRVREISGNIFRENPYTISPANQNYS